MKPQDDIRLKLATNSLKLLQLLLLLPFVAFSACQNGDHQVSTGTPQTCEQMNSSRILQQVGFQSVFAGKTTTVEIRELFGKPNAISSYSNIEEWIYPELKLTVISNVVSSLTVDRQSTEMLRIREYVEKYGCPEDIYAFAPYEDLPPDNDSYSTADLMYPSIGLEIYTSFPTSLNDLPTAVVYIPPTSLESLNENIRFPKTEVAWDELIQLANEKK